MSFLALAPTIAATAAKNAGVSSRSKVIGTAADGRIIAVAEHERKPKTLMAVYPGYLIPPQAEQKEIDPQEVEAVFLKFSPDPLMDPSLSWEKRMLSELPTLAGIPRIIAEGRTKVLYPNRSGPPSEWGITERNAPFFILSSVAGRDLSTFALERWSESFPTREQIALLAEKVFPALAERIAVLHKNNAIHRDVKPANALYDEESNLAGLVDFGHANWLDAQHAKHDRGTSGFHAPELLLDPPQKEDVRIDVYGLGTTCFKTLTGEGGIVYEGVTDIFEWEAAAFSFIPQDVAVARYYEEISAFASANLKTLVAKSNLPAELKETPLGEYLISLMHPNREQRPANMAQIATELRKLGGEFSAYA